MRIRSAGLVANRTQCMSEGVSHPWSGQPPGTRAKLSQRRGVRYVIGGLDDCNVSSSVTDST